MRRAIVTGSGGLIGSESVAHFVEAGFDVVGIENDMRARFFGPEASTAPTDRAARSSLRRRFRSLDARHPRRRRRRLASSPSIAPGSSSSIHTAAQPSHDWAASEPQTDFGVNANGTLNLLEATRRHAPTRRSSSPRRTRSTATARTSLPLVELETRLELPEDHDYYGGHRHLDVDRPVDALAVRRLEGGRRPARPGVRALLRHADGLLPRRLPDRPQPRRRRAARLPLLPDALHGHRRAATPSSATAASRCATTSTAPTSCARSRPSTPSRASAAVYNLGGGRGTQLLDARGDRALRADRRPRARLGARATSRGSATTAGGSATSPRFERDYPDWELTLRHRGHPARDLRAERRALERARAALERAKSTRAAAARRPAAGR